MSPRKTSSRPVKSRRVQSFRPQLELLESRLAPAIYSLLPASLDHALIGFDAATGSLSLSSGAQGADVHIAATAGGLAVSINGQLFSSNAADAFFNPALAGANATTLHTINLTGGGSADALTLDNLSGSNVTVQSDGAVTVAGSVHVAGQFTVTASSLTVDGAVQASALSLNSAGLINVEAGGSLIASAGGQGGTIAAAADYFVNVGQVRADGGHGGSVAIVTRDYLNAGAVSASGAGVAGDVEVHFAESYIDTAAASTSATGAGGKVSIDGGAGSRLFSSGRFDATGTTGGAIDLFGQDIFLVGATVDASGTAGAGGKVRVGGDYHGGATGFPNAQTLDVTGSTVLRATGAGAGGRVTVWSEANTDFTGAVTAKGGAAGGFIEVSSHGQLTYGGTADAGSGGTLLLDPKNLIVSAAPTGLFPQYSLINPSGNGAFGTQILQLSNGNIAVLDPRANSNRGAAYLFNGQTGALISVFTGSAANDSFGTLTALTGNNNFLVVSPNWNQAKGAVTWASGTTGVSGVISNVTSLVGSSAGDTVGKFITLLANGNYVVDSPSWNSQRGAVTWANGATGLKGVVSATNSLIGSNAGDLVGQDPSGGNGITVLPNNNYVVDSPNWNGQEGAVTWVSGAAGLSGAVSSSNSLTGTVAGDLVGEGPGGTNGVVVLPSNGNYVVDSPNWNGLEGAVTWGSATAGVSGLIDAFNSLVGSAAGDQVGAVTDGTTVLSTGGVTVLGNGNYVVDSPNWSSGVGAVTLGQGATGTTVGVLTNSNSLVGSVSGNFVGLQGVTALANNNYVVSSADWSNGKGAVTFGNGTTGVAGVVAAANSLVGSAAGDHIGGIGVVTGITIGVNGITSLPNGNYVVDSPDWTGGEGAVTFGNGSTGVKGVVAAANSLVGSVAGDKVGQGPGGTNGVVVLGNSSNYVVVSPNWSGGDGAVTFGLAATGVKGVVAAANSLVGSAATDNVGSKGVTVLSNNSYVVDSPNWTGGKGAATFGNAATGVKGAVSALNSLVGSVAGDDIGSAGVVALLTNGNYVVVSPNWNGNLGAVTWGSSAAPIVGVITAVNSLVGALAGDRVGGLTNTSLSSSVTPLSNGNYVVVTYAFGGGKGAVTFGLGASGVKGVVSAANSLIGSNADGGAFPIGDHVGYSVALDAPALTQLTGGNFIVSSPKWKGGTGAVTWESNTAGVVGVLSAANSLVGSNTTDNVGSGGVAQLSNGNFVVLSPTWNSTLGAATWGSAAAGVKGTVGVANSLVGSLAGDSVGGSGVTALASGNYVVNSGGWSNFTGAATWANGTSGATLDGLNTIDAQNSVLGSQTSGSANLSTQAGPSGVPGSFLSTFTAESGGLVRIGFTDPNELTYALAQGQAITVTPSFLTQTLNAGTNVILSANDDITINSPITEIPVGAPGGLTLQAGRSIFLNANINTAGGNLSLIANDSKLDGVVDAQRDAGNAVIKMATGVTLNTGAGTLSVDLKNGVDKTNNGAGVATLLGLTSSSTTVSSATTLGVAINGTTAGDGTGATYTQTSVAGPITLTGASLQVTHGASTAVGSVFTIVTATGGVTGMFAGLAQGARVIADDGTPFTITYSGNTVILTQDAITTTSVSSNSNPAPGNTPVTFTATVQNTSGSGGAPAGSVEFFDGTNDIGAGVAGAGGVSSSTWTFTTSALTVGSHTIKAVYTPTSSFLGSTGSMTEVIQTSTNTAVLSSNNPSTFGELVTFQATVTSNGGKPTGSVEFFDGTTDIGAGALISAGGPNTAIYILSTSGLSFGAHSIKAVFTASGAFLGSTSPAFGQTVSSAIRTAVLQVDGSLLQYGPGGGFTLLSPAGTILAVSAVTDGNGLNEIFAITSDHHLWEYSPLGWAILSDGSFQQISAATNQVGDPVVFGMLSDNSLWEYGSQFNGWKQLSPSGILSISAVTEHPAANVFNDVVFAITTDTNLWVHSPSTGWKLLSTGSFLQISAGVNTSGQAELFGVLADHSLWAYNAASPSGWNIMSAAGTVLSVSAGARGEVVAIMADQHLWDNKAGAWSLLSAGSFASISATQTPTGTTEVFATLTDTSLWEFDPLFAGGGWKDLITSGVASSSTPQRVK